MADVELGDEWDWCSEYVRRAVGGKAEEPGGTAGETIKLPDRDVGANADQLGLVLAALDRGQPVACLGWWPTADALTSTPTLGVDVLDVPTPDRKGTTLQHGNALVLVGYARHDAYAGGGYLVVRAPIRRGGRWERGDVQYVPFVYLRAYATMLWTARREGTAELGQDDRPPPRSTADVDREIRARSRCADPSGNHTALFFSEKPIDTLRAKAICSVCVVRDPCLQRAIERREPYGVWGGEFLLDGEIVLVKRGRGRPSRRPLPDDVDEITGEPTTPAVA
jgi:WhiB family redox-sensing transcriptional regulator